ncbi:putative ABC transport system permease protein [Flavobacterium croceum DSM 17960]|uniref:Putative ABC transport system permease protein n=1 Tax=Flavobacterium croceum DSM 17960 TaxID=1121886 RepID=A0A2S4N561_9FLAO|nr:ABC transporter permease [Flavobacterium croceum]POS00868.1 putative ABC transport system permease protein [Flavobacterium croceum DSM 17960]
MRGIVKENIKIAFGAIRTQLLRTILTVIIIAFGIWALVGILTVVSALDNTLNTKFASMGSNTFFINQYDSGPRRHGGGDIEKVNPIITYSQAKSFKEKYKFPLTHCSLSFTATSVAEVKYENEKTNPEIQVLGIDENYTLNSGLEVTKGRNFNAFDIQNNVYFCVVGSDFSTKGLLKDVNPIDKILTIRGAKFKVIGVLKEQGSTFGNSKDSRIYIPIQVARSLYSNANINYSLSVLVDRSEMLDAAVGQATITFKNIRKQNPSSENNFGITRSDDLVHKIAEMTGVLNIAATIIGIITIFGSSIALMNIMIVSVTERTREIGVRKSLGAKKGTIAWQFFTETLIVGQLGGLLGILLGIFTGYIAAAAMDFDFVIPWKAMMAAVGITFVVAVISGLYPAIKASKLDPIEALRYE